MPLIAGFGMLIHTKSRRTEIIKDKFGDFRHAVVVGIIHVLIAVIILHQEAKHILIGNGILNQILMQTVAEYFLGGMSVHVVLHEDRRTCKAEQLRVIKELDDILMAITEMASMTFIEDHDDA